MQSLWKYYKRCFIGLMTFFLGITAVRAGNDGGGGQVRAVAVLDGSQHQIRKDSAVTVEDSVFFNPANAGKIDSSYAVQDQVTLMINESSTLYLRSAFNVTVTLRISYTDAKGDTASAIRSFTVGYDSAHTYNSRSSFVFSGAHKVTVQVISDSTNVTTWDPLSVLLIETQLTAAPVFHFNCSATVSNITVNPTLDPNADELPVSWNVIQGADQYDLEWTWVDSSALADTSRFGPSPYDPTRIFHNSATRVTISGTSYNIPIIYDNTGTLFIRVRPVQLGRGYTVVNAVWSSDASPSVMGQYTFRGHQRPLNWQSNISFAEEGKRKVVVQYYDGSLRSRQTVTKDNTTNTTIVGETYYDYQGRPAIQVMPAPTLKTVIQYTAGFNVGLNAPEYSQSNYDTLADPTAYCSAHADSMRSDSGASLYYSPKNPVASAGLNQFIPDAHDYPFSETEYMPDNTGRIKRQGGVGPYHQLGSGHETKYYYETPDGNQLEALFGTEVGDKSHYFKNSVRDANGQYSVSYLDMHGRTIATALAGDPPPAMAALPSYNRKRITETLADSTSVVFQGQSMISQKSFVVKRTDTFYFNYNFAPEILNEVNCRQQSVCYTCRYDLDITITDDCNNCLLSTLPFNNASAGHPFTVSKRNFSLATLANSCQDSSMNLSFNLVMPEGGYTVTKTLTVDRDAYNFYRDSIYLPNNTCTTIGQFISLQTALAQAANPQCTPVCTGCTTTDADDIRNAMLQDMTPPYGQYADTLRAANADRYSIFYIPTDDSLDFVPLYKLPSVVYRDVNGDPDSVFDPASGLMVNPNSLSPARFVQNFRPSWAEALLPYHPEYCRLQVMQANNNSLLYDRHMEAVDTYQAAVDSGYINPTNDPNFPISNTGNIDPFTNQQGTALNAKLDNFETIPNSNTKLSLWGMACSMVACKSDAQSCPANFAVNSQTFQTLCTGDQDMAWRYFREMYLGAKQDIFNKTLLANPAGCTPANNRVYTKEPTFDSLLNTNHQPEFSDAAHVLDRSYLKDYSQVSGPTDAANKQQAIVDSMGSSYAANSQAYASQWLQELSACSLYDPNDVKNTLLPALTNLCQQASDVDHPFGASSLPAGQSVTFGGQQCFSFQDIINTYNQQHGIHPLTALDTINCNAEVIVAPLPYGNQPVYSAKPVYSRPSDCECGLITGLYNNYTLSSFGDASFSAFLARTEHITMTDADLTALRAMCSAPSDTSCQNLSRPIYLPPVMQCNSGPGCARCQTIDSLYNAYIAVYPTSLPADSVNGDSLQAQKNALFQNFMNNRLGFSLQAYEYLQFMDTCVAHKADTGTDVSCGSKTITAESLFGNFTNIRGYRTAPNGSFYVIGETIAASSDSNVGLIARFNSSGGLQWAKRYQGPKYTTFFRIRVTPDGGFVAAGATSFLISDALHSSTEDSRILILRGDSLGNTIWKKSINLPAFTGVIGGNIIQTQDGGYAVISNSLGSVSNLMGAVLKLDSSGNVLWTRAMHPPGSNAASGGMIIFDLAEKGDTLLVAGEQVDSAGSSQQGLFAKLNETTGVIISSNAIAIAGDASVWGITPDSNGYRLSLELVDSTNESMAGVVKLGLDGTIQVSKAMHFQPGYGGSSVYGEEAHAATSDGAWVATGNTLIDGVAGSCVVKVNPDGTEAWAIGRKSDLYGLQILQKADGGYLLGGDNGVSFLSPSGAVGCGDTSLAIPISNLSASSIPQTLIGDSSLTYNYESLSVTEIPGTLDVLAINCQGNGNGGCYSNYNGPLLCGKSQPLLPPVAVSPATVCTDSTFFGNMAGTALFKAYSDSLTGGFEKTYLNLCMQGYRHESFTMTHMNSEYHYTLYYYDQAGNLLKTVPPAGVQENDDTVWIHQVEAAKKAGQVMVPNHALITNYRYNTLNQVSAQRSPDGGGSQFWYDRLGRLTLSQNARQLPNSQYSYTQYDTLGRIIQVGQLMSGSAINDTLSRSDSSLQAWMASALPSANQITVTTYDSGSYAIEPQLVQRNVRNRVSWTALYNTAADWDTLGPAAATYFTYDILGNVDTLVQDFGRIASANGVPNSMMAANNRFKKIAYDFDLASGKVNSVAYQQGSADAFYHTYLYDAENRITNVQSSTDGVNWDNDAFYSYYAHGPLARSVLGQQQVQGISYAYTLQGWMKGINPTPYTGGSFTLRPDSNGNVVANNAYSLLLNYFDGDFKPISTAAGPDSAVSTSLGADYRPLYNGNISSMGASIRNLGNPMLYNYQYDQLNRLVHMDAWSRTSTPWSAITKTTDFKENIAYDPNGNIQKYLRNGSAATSSTNMDNLSYSYLSGTNKLDHITDSVSGYCSTCQDITTQAAGNYKYDSIGELTADAASNITGITWTVYGKIASITKSGDTTIRFTYDAAGNRVSKSVIHDGDVQTTWYVRDGQGNILSVYTYGDAAVNAKDLTQTELDVYGSSRLGLWKRSVDVAKKPASDSVSIPLIGSGDSLIFTRGNKLFELTNHLGNVLSTISDKRYGVSGNDSTVTYFNPDIVSANDYYPFGMFQPGRAYTQAGSGNYRYGFNGKERDDEIKGSGNQMDFGNRIYDSRTARWASLDPLQAKYPNETPYGFAGGNPQIYMDKDGKEKVITITTYHKDGRVTQIQKTDKAYYAYSSHWTDLSAQNGYPSLKFTGTKESVYETYIIDENMQGVIKSDVSTRTEEIFSWPFTYEADKLTGDQSGKEKYGYVLFGSAHDMENNKGNERAATGSEILDIDALISSLQAYRDLPTKKFSNPDIKDFISDPKAKELFERVDNFVKGLDGVVTANHGELPFGPKPLPADSPGDYKPASTTSGAGGRRKLDTIWVKNPNPAVGGMIGVYDPPGASDSEYIYMPLPPGKKAK